jgi:hypothetical protein
MGGAAFFSSAAEIFGGVSSCNSFSGEENSNCESAIRNYGVTDGNMTAGFRSEICAGRLSQNSLHKNIWI